MDQSTKTASRLFLGALSQDPIRLPLIYAIAPPDSDRLATRRDTETGDINGDKKEEGYKQGDDRQKPQCPAVSPSTQLYTMHRQGNGTAAAHDGPDPRVGEETPLLAKADDGDTTTAANPAPWSWETDFEGVSWYRKPSIWWLLPAYAIYALAFGGIIVPKLNLVLTLVCRRYIAAQSTLHPDAQYTPVIMFANNPQCRIPEVQALATEFTLYMSLITGILSAAISPKIGALSDRYGRKYFLAFAVFGGLCAEIVTILAATYPDTVHYQWILFGSVLDGLFGSFTSAMAMTHSYGADVTTPAKRGVAFGYFSGALFGGIALGPLLAAFISRVTGNILSVFWIAFFCHLTVLLYHLFLLPESLSTKRQLAARTRHEEELSAAATSPTSRAAQAANFLAPLKILYPTGAGASSHLRANLILLAAINTLLFGASIGIGSVLIYYTNYTFDWGDFETQMFVGLTSAFRVVVLITLLPLITYIFRTRYQKRRAAEAARNADPDAVPDDTRTPGADTLDLVLIRGALVLEVVCYAGYASARHGGVFFMFGVLGAGGSIALPLLQSALSKHVGADRVGQLLGATALLNGLARVVFPAVFGGLYSLTVGRFPQAVFVVLSVTFGGMAVLSWFVRPHVYLEAEEPRQTGTSDARTSLLAEELVDEEVVGR
ncbi:hypothetical protein V492_07443 [Pseudogymnoascus sp. VKM F-4246]|nr:hypothetical protein V492_07443 [Pseudogymnoascus sp. VKM F-4246]